jgi:predicted GNAT family acetyltransferase
MARTPVTIRLDRERRRVEAVVEDGPDQGQVAGFSQYRASGEGVKTFFHTEVDDRFEGQGIGSQLAAGVVRTAREQGFTIVPVCSFIRRYLREHEDTHDVLAEGASLEDVA